MGRNLRPELDYSQIDTGYTQKSLQVKIRLKFGLLGHVTLYEVIAWINAGKGCYAECKDLEEVAMAFSMTRLGSLDHAPKVVEIFQYMLETGFFDPEAYSSDKILTSEGIFRRWWTSKKRPEAYKLPPSLEKYAHKISADEKPISAYEKPKKRQKQVFRDFSADEKLRNAPKSPQNVPKTPQKAPKVKYSKVKYSTMGGDSCTLYSSAHAREDDFAPPSDVEDFDSPQEPEFDPVTEVVREWNEVFSGTGREYRHFYPDAALSHNIRESWKVYSDLNTYRKVFEAARREYESDEKFPWVLGSVFAKPNTFDVLLAKSSLPPPQSKTRGAPVATAEEYEKYGWAKKSVTT